MKNTAHIGLNINYFNYLYYYDKYIEISMVMCVNNVFDYGCWCKCGIFYCAAHLYHQMASITLTCFYKSR